MKKVDFESLKPIDRLTLIRACKEELIKQVRKNKIDYSLLITGSTGYGFNGNEHGRLNDVDCIAVLPDKLKYKNFISKLFLDEPDFPSEDDFEYFMKDDNENTPSVLRVSGLLNGVKVSIHLVKRSTLVAVLNNPEYMIYNLIPRAHERLILTNSRYEVLGDGTQIVDTPNITDYKFDETKILIPECIFKTTQVNSEKIIVKGALGDKLLISQVEYLNPKVEVSDILTNVWIKFAELSRSQNSLVTSEQLVNSIVRSRFFQPEFKENILVKANLSLN